MKCFLILILEIVCSNIPVLFFVTYNNIANLNKYFIILKWGLLNPPKPYCFVDLSLQSKIWFWEFLKKNLTWTKIITCCCSIFWSLFLKFFLLYFFKDEDFFSFFFICYIMHMPFFVFICKTYITYIFYIYIPNRKNFLGLAIGTSKKVQIKIIKTNNSSSSKK